WDSAPRHLARSDWPDAHPASDQTGSVRPGIRKPTRPAKSCIARQSLACAGSHRDVQRTAGPFLPEISDTARHWVAALALLGRCGSQAGCKSSRPAEDAGPAGDKERRWLPPTATATSTSHADASHRRRDNDDWLQDTPV